MEYKKGDKVYIKTFWHGIFVAEILDISNGLFFKKYLCSWVVNDLDYEIKYNKIGIMRCWNIVGIFNQS